jgi:hypothetical protein
VRPETVGLVSSKASLIGALASEAGVVTRTPQVRPNRGQLQGVAEACLAAHAPKHKRLRPATGSAKPPRWPGDTSGIQGMSSFEPWCECPKDIRGLPKIHASQGEDGPLARHRPGAFSPKERELQAGKPQAIDTPEVHPPAFTGAPTTIPATCMETLTASSSRRLAKKLAGGARNPRSAVTGTTGCLSPHRALQRWREKSRHLLALPPGRIVLRQFTGGSARSSLHHRLMAFKLPAWRG